MEFSQILGNSCTWSSKSQFCVFDLVNLWTPLRIQLIYINSLPPLPLYYPVLPPPPQISAQLTRTHKIFCFALKLRFSGVVEYFNFLFFNISRWYLFFCFLMFSSEYILLWCLISLIYFTLVTISTYREKYEYVYYLKVNVDTYLQFLCALSCRSHCKIYILVN